MSLIVKSDLVSSELIQNFWIATVDSKSIPVLPTILNLLQHAPCMLTLACQRIPREKMY